MVNYKLSAIPEYQRELALDKLDMHLTQLSVLFYFLVLPVQYSIGKTPIYQTS